MTTIPVPSRSLRLAAVAPALAVAVLCVACVACGGSGAPRQERGRGAADRPGVAPATPPSTRPSTQAPAPRDTVVTTARAAAAAAAAAHGPVDSAHKAMASDSASAIARATAAKGRTFRDDFSLRAEIRAGLENPSWPVETPSPLPGSVLPAHRIVAFYGNPLSKKMGILGEIPYDQMLAKLDTVARQWRAADPSHPVQPALQLIVSVAQGTPGKDGMYRQRSDPDLIEKIYGMAHQRGYLTILDIQAGQSTIEQELPVIVPFLRRPDVHLAIDPEFYMHYDREGRAPGTKIGTLTAKEVNYAVDQLAQLVSRYHLPPKVLVVHRFTTHMLQDAEQITLDPRVQVVINMDGWGQPWLKFDTYRACEEAEPVQFTGFKLFFHNDTRKGDALLSPIEVLALRPRPLYIQYQ